MVFFCTKKEVGKLLFKIVSGVGLGWNTLETTVRQWLRVFRQFNLEHEVSLVLAK